MASIPFSEPIEPWGPLQESFGQAPVVLYVAGPLRGDGSPEAIRKPGKISGRCSR